MENCGIFREEYRGQRNITNRAKGPARFFFVYIDTFSFIKAKYVSAEIFDSITSKAMITLIVGCIDNISSIIAEQNIPICDPPIYVTISFQTMMAFQIVCFIFSFRGFIKNSDFCFFFMLSRTLFV